MVGLSAIIRRERVRIDERTVVYKRVLTIEGRTKEIHVSLVRKIDEYEHDIMRYDLDEEGSHMHLKALNMVPLDVSNAQTLTKRYDLLMKKIKIMLEESACKASKR